MTDFQKALDDLPDGTGIDAHHNSIDDLCWLCLHELDLHAEGEFRHDPSNLRKYYGFIKKYGTDADKKEAWSVYQQALKQTEFHLEN